MKFSNITNIKFRRIITPVFAGTGIVLFCIYLFQPGTPEIRIADLSPEMNFKQIKIRGEVSGQVTQLKRGGIIFEVDDGTGVIAVSGGRAVTSSLRHAGKIPQHGDRVEVTGNLNAAQDFEYSLCLSAAEQFILYRQALPDIVPPPELQLAEIIPALEGKTVAVRGVLTSVEISLPHSRMPYRLLIESAGISVPVVFWDDVMIVMGDRLPAPGKMIRVCGRVELYKEEIQIRLFRADGLQEIK
ncbi:MAG: hypothetical protein WC959_09370 [Kiritimatiellales bacterium]